MLAPDFSPERIKPGPVVVDQNMGFFDLGWRHFLYHFLLGDRGVRIAADGREDVPHVGPHKVGCGKPATNLVVPSDTRLRARMAFHRRAQIPFKRPYVVLHNAKAGGVHHTDKLFGLGITRTGCWQKLCHGGGVVARIHQIARGFNFGQRRTGKKEKYGGKVSHAGVLLAMVVGGSAYGYELPRPLQASDFLEFDQKQVELGQLLFFDPILSGNRNISCATCHSPEHGTSDGLSLGIGEGGSGTGPKRTAGVGADRIKKRIPRNAPALWNLGAKDIPTLFHDGRISHSDIYGNGFNTPAQEWLPDGLNSILAVQALFPMTSQFEMAGDPKENQIAGAAYDRIDAVWPIVAKRIRVIDDYARLFVAAFDDVEGPLDITIVHVANALAAFEATEFQSYDGPFDAYLSGDETALSLDQRAGMDLFFGKAGCSGCHSGKLLTDHRFHALMLPQFGPGRTRQWDPVVRDPGHMGVSDRLEDAYRFRTPPLRNVALTAPYGHKRRLPDVGGHDQASS